MKYIYFLLSLYISFFCIHSYAQTKEEQCLQSSSLSFKDPESLKVIKNLGSRGQTDDGSEFFWLRYSATNSYGGRVSASMACKKNENNSGWIRDKERENALIARIQVYVDEIIKNALEKNSKGVCQGYGCNYEANQAGIRAGERAIERSRRKYATLGTELVIEGYDDLSEDTFKNLK